MRRLLSSIALLLAASLYVPLAAAQEGTPAPLAGECAVGTEDENVVVAERWLDVWNSQDVSLYEAVAHPDTVHHFGQVPDAEGLAALQANTAAFFTAFPDLELVPEQVIAEDNLVAIRFTVSGTHTGPFFGIEPTGTGATWTGINIYRIECGVVVESWSEADGLGLRRQLGVLGDPTGATPTS